MTFIEIMTVYAGSDGDATTSLYNRLRSLGPAGHVAVNVFRAMKASERAKVYRGGERGKGSYKAMAYDRKQWAMDQLAQLLSEHADALGINWGWQEDITQEFHKWVLYIDLPTGQVSYHTAGRGRGPFYSGVWDRAVDQGPTRTCRWIEGLFRQADEVAA